MTTKQVQTKKNIQAYIIDCIDSSSYDVVTTTPQEKLKFLYDTFKAEYGFNIDRVGEYKAFENWTQGLPTVFNIEFENYKILELAKEMGGLEENATEKQEDKVLENYWNYITVNTFQLFKKYKIA